MVIQVREAIAQHVQFLEGQGKARTTIDTRISNLRGRTGFLAACQRVKGPNVTMGQIDDDCITEFFRSHTGSAGTRNNKLGALKAFLQWAERRKMLRPGFTTQGLLDGQKHKRYKRGQKLYLEAGDFAELLNHAGDHHPRDRAVVALVLYTLARQSEVRVVRLKDLDLDAKTMQIWREKTDEWTEVGISAELSEELDTWLAWYADHTGYATAAEMIAEHPDWWLTPGGVWGARWRDLVPDKQAVVLHDMFKRALGRMGYSEADLLNEGAHTGRRSGARALFLHLRDTLGYDGAVFRVQAMLHHADPMVTQRYIDIDRERDDLNAWLRTNRMYGDGKPAAAPAPVVTLPEPAESSNVVTVDFSRRRGA